MWRAKRGQPRTYGRPATGVISCMGRWVGGGREDGLNELLYGTGWVGGWVGGWVSLLTLTRKGRP